ncbi:MAG: hypothetical protein ACM31O_01510 [Bacteroidota bacterium]
MARARTREALDRSRIVTPTNTYLSAGLATTLALGGLGLVTWYYSQRDEVAHQLENVRAVAIEQKSSIDLLRVETTNQTATLQSKIDGLARRVDAASDRAWTKQEHQIWCMQNKLRGKSLSGLTCPEFGPQQLLPHEARPTRSAPMRPRQLPQRVEREPFNPFATR